LVGSTERSFMTTSSDIRPVPGFPIQSVNVPPL
jgi:hypothetical protein